MTRSMYSGEHTSISPEHLFNRELSWLEFNRRVLAEAFDSRTPLLERLKFLGIFSSNLDEFFMVRVAALKRQVDRGFAELTHDGRTPQKQLDEIHERLLPMVTEQHQFFENTIRPMMKSHGIHLVNYIDLNDEQRGHLQRYYDEKVFPILTPLAIDTSHPFPLLSNLSLNLMIVLRNADTQEKRIARLKVPGTLPRFVELPEHLIHPENGQSVVWMGVPLEQVVAHNLESLFPGMDIQEYHPFRITRDADVSIQEEEGDDLMIMMEQELRKRRVGGSVVRIEINPGMPESTRKQLFQELDIRPEDIYLIEGLLNLKDLMSFLGLPLPHLKDKPWTPLPPRWLQEGIQVIESPTGEIQKDMFSIIRERDVLVHYPYQSFATTAQVFLEQAARDPDVLGIKMTLYRTSSDSPILRSLITAAENEKQVAVLVELKARFDEENNIQWARKLESNSIHVVYGVAGLKTHTKTIMVVRQEEDGIRRYVYIGTGNFNPKTAKLYVDMGFMSCRRELGEDLTDLFNFLTGYSRQQSYRKLLIAPVNMRDRFLGMIRREIDHAHNGRGGRIVAKMNSLVDTKMIAALYEASQAGVTIDLIVRGICCLRPGVPGVSDNIKVISVVGRFLEHSRIFYFLNGGAEEVYIGSADWMHRNLDRRVEAVVPIEDPELIKDVQEVLGVLLSDNRQAWDLQPDGQYIQRHPSENSSELGSHSIFMQNAAKELKG